MSMELSEQLSELKRKVDYNTYDISVKELISMTNDGIIDIAPEYQRQFRWKEGRQSALVESVLLGIPVPSLYMATNKNGTWELIDGVQRLSSLIRFAGSIETKKKISIEGNLVLTDLNKLTSFNGLSFLELPKTVQLEFLLKPMKITTLSDKSNLEVRFDLFERLNTGGIALTDQEIRSCVYRGKFNDFLKKMSEDVNYKSAVRLNSAQEMDGTREEFVLRFFSFYHGYMDFDHSVVDFLNSFMGEFTKRFDYKTGEKIFRSTFKELSKLPEGITRNRTTTPTNLFEGVAVGAALALQKKRKLNLSNAKRWISSKELNSFTTGATNSKTKVVKRIEYCRDKFLA